VNISYLLAVGREKEALEIKGLSDLSILRLLFLTADHYKREQYMIHLKNMNGEIPACLNLKSFVLWGDAFAKEALEKSYNEHYLIYLMANLSEEEFMKYMYFNIGSVTGSLIRLLISLHDVLKDNTNIRVNFMNWMRSKYVLSYIQYDTIVVHMLVLYGCVSDVVKLVNGYEIAFKFAVTFLALEKPEWLDELFDGVRDKVRWNVEDLEHRAFEVLRHRDISKKRKLEFCDRIQNLVRKHPW
jgi:hypothetical protein